MKFHTPSFVLGAGLAAATFAARARLWPVVVEVGALGLHLARLGRELILRRREGVEDLWAEVEARERERERRREDEEQAAAPAVRGARRSVVNGASSP